MVPSPVMFSGTYVSCTGHRHGCIAERVRGGLSIMAKSIIIIIVTITIIIFITIIIIYYYVRYAWNIIASTSPLRTSANFTTENTFVLLSWRDRRFVWNLDGKYEIVHTFFLDLFDKCNWERWVFNILRYLAKYISTRYPLSSDVLGCI